MRSLGEILMHGVHTFDVVAYFLVEARLLCDVFRLVVCPQHTHELVLPIFPFFARFEISFENTDFYVCFEVVTAAVNVICKFIIVRARFRVKSMITESFA